MRSLATALVALALLAGAGRHATAEPAGYPFVEVTLLNESRWAASGVTVTAAPGRSIGGVEIISELPDCYPTRISIPITFDRATIEWPRACIAPGEYVFVRLEPGCAQCEVDIGDVEWTHDALGDPTCDGRKNSIDALAILQDVAGVIPNVTCAENSDVNGDGAGDALDASLILQYAAGELDHLPV